MKFQFLTKFQCLTNFQILTKISIFYLISIFNVHFDFNQDFVTKFSFVGKTLYVFIIDIPKISKTSKNISQKNSKNKITHKLSPKHQIYITLTVQISKESFRPIKYPIKFETQYVHLVRFTKNNIVVILFLDITSPRNKIRKFYKFLGKILENSNIKINEAN